MFTVTDQGELLDIPRYQQDPFLDWCIATNADPSSNEAREAYLQEVAEWDRTHDRTAICANPDCRQGMKDDGREFCSHRCYRTNPAESTDPTNTTKENN